MVPDFQDTGFQDSSDENSTGQNSGEHLYVHIRKRNQNTRWVAAEIARQLELPEVAIGFCGLKDRRAVTTQWFSLHLPEHHRPVREGSLSVVSNNSKSNAFPQQDKQILQRLHLEECEILTHQRGSKKLRRGMHIGNRFKLRLRKVEGKRAAIQQRLEQIVLGVPNYFGEQRFGIGGQNLVHADALLRRPRIRGGGRQGLYLSAARSYLFNQILAARIKAKCWTSPLAVENINQSAAQADVSPDGALWGRGRSTAHSALVDFESSVLSPWSAWLHGLEHCGLTQERRGLILKPENFQSQWQTNDLVLTFELPVGTYATAVLRELLSARTAT